MVCYSVDGCLLLLGDDESSLSTFAFLSLLEITVFSALEKEALELFGVLGYCLFLGYYIRYRVRGNFGLTAPKEFAGHWDLAELPVE